MQSRGVPDELRSADVRVPSYSFPENAARALARVASYGEWLTRPSTLPVFDDIQKDECSAIIDKAAASGGGWLEPHDVWSVLSKYGLPVLAQRVVSSAEEAGEAALEFGGRIALKGIAPGLVHKTDAGAVRLDLSADAVTAAAKEMSTRITRSTAL